MSKILPFPPIRPPFLEIKAEQCEGYKFAVYYRDERYRGVVIWLSASLASSRQRAQIQEPAFGLPIVDLTRPGHRHG